jgi:hypothetical protein
MNPFRWGRGDIEPASKYKFFCVKGIENRESGNRFLYITGTAVKGVEPVTDGMSYTTVRGRW